MLFFSFCLFLSLKSLWLSTTTTTTPLPHFLKFLNSFIAHFLSLFLWGLYPINDLSPSQNSPPPSLTREKEEGEASRQLPVLITSEDHL